ncbi:MAG: hypothetical protein EXQ75_02570 [Candidatus Planktophila sp.]|nr:hypothetical protein [Candidatus Planktophila sp.]
MIARKNLLNKYLTSAVIALIAMTPVAQAAPKTVSIKPLKVFSQSSSAEAIVANSKAIYTYENIMGLSADIKVRAFDFTGTEIWSQTVDSGLDEVATAMAVDSQGTLWLVGNKAIAPQSESATAATGALNPDGIEIEDIQELRPDMKNISVWQISATGEIIGQTSIETVALIDAISVSLSGLSILASRESEPFLITLSQGKFSKELKIGTAKTKLGAITRSNDGTTYLFGSSSEILGGKKLVGRVDGILIKIAKTGSISSVARSSAPKAIRDWQSTTSSLFVTGSVKSGTTVESAITKFNSSFVPSWTTRISSTGRTMASSGVSGSFYAILEPTSAIKGVTGFKVVKGQSVVLQFDSKGLLISAFTPAEITSIITSTYSSTAGLFLLTTDGKILQIPNT